MSALHARHRLDHAESPRLQAGPGASSSGHVEHAADAVHREARGAAIRRSASRPRGRSSRSPSMRRARATDRSRTGTSVPRRLISRAAPPAPWSPGHALEGDLPHREERQRVSSPATEHECGTRPAPQRRGSASHALACPSLLLRPRSRPRPTRVEVEQQHEPPSTSPCRAGSQPARRAERRSGLDLSGFSSRT